MVFITVMILSWRLQQATEIIAVHSNEKGTAFRVIMKYPPVTDKGKIKWWEENNMIMNDKYHVPVDKGSYLISFWVSDYKKNSNADQEGDLLCFNDMNTTANCIEKNNNPLTILYNHDTHQMMISLNNGESTYFKNTLTGHMRKVD